jgi:hypothetical protein
MTSPEAPGIGLAATRTRQQRRVPPPTRPSFSSSGSVGTFAPDMTAGLGYIALAALLFRRWTPLGEMAAALLFGFTLKLGGVTSSPAWNAENSDLCQAEGSAA